MIQAMNRLPDMPALADRLIYVRKIKGLTQADLAALAKTSQQAIQQAESGKALNPRYLPRLARELDIPVEWLSLNDTADKMPAPGLSEKDDQVLGAFKAMDGKDQELILELMKARGAKRPS